MESMVTLRLRRTTHPLGLVLYQASNSQPLKMKTSGMRCFKRIPLLSEAHSHLQKSISADMLMGECTTSAILMAWSQAKVATR
jgi:hypothetical protein